MPKCPSCRHSFRVMEDEQNMHSCPHCGLEPDAKRCVECREWFTSPDYAAVRCAECAPDETTETEND